MPRSILSLSSLPLPPSTAKDRSEHGRGENGPQGSGGATGGAAIERIGVTCRIDGDVGETDGTYDDSSDENDIMSIGSVARSVSKCHSAAVHLEEDLEAEPIRLLDTYDDYYKIHTNDRLSSAVSSSIP